MRRLRHRYVVIGTFLLTLYMQGCYLIQVVISRLFLLWSFERFDVTANKLDYTLVLEMMGSDHVLVNDGYGDCLIYVTL